MHIVTTSVEHHSVLHPMNYLETLGFDVTYLPVDQTGRVTAQQVEQSIRPDTILVSIIYGNNEVGAINPISEIGAALGKKDILFHTDAVQAYGNQQINVEKEGIDLLSVTAHKLNGPKGIGFLYRKHQLHLPHFIHGGSQENDHRAGTENVPYIEGFAKAVEKLMVDQERNNQHKQDLKDFFIEELKNKEVIFHINGMKDDSLPHILNLWIPHLQSDKLLIQCDLKGIMISAGSACTAGSLEPSHVLQAMFGEEDERIHESIRVSFGKQNTQEEVTILANVISDLQNKYTH
ncbi:cysteine desulfurase family protein [Jeotgalibaca sp. MA1X17-3]|uniref:cysteine desulfurase family protein n=1 Tax=Jeotgalibaca sp. MA1X17-3 TaxID=2908211 RepID=UPI0028834C02|nr:cysteine desulfurase family protein [Jeotgalibaca sp. MA1X17-3]